MARVSVTRRVRVGDDGVLYCRKCGSTNMLVRLSDAPYRKKRPLVCADCDERQSWRPGERQPQVDQRAGGP
jgi:hypothetical protein